MAFCTLQLAVAFSQECERLIEDYVDRVSDHVLYRIGKCGPLSKAYNTTTSLVCRQIFTPFVRSIFLVFLLSFLLFFFGGLFRIAGESWRDLGALSTFHFLFGVDVYLLQRDPDFAILIVRI